MLCVCVYCMGMVSCPPIYSMLYRVKCVGMAMTQSQLLYLLKFER